MLQTLHPGIREKLLLGAVRNEAAKAWQLAYAAVAQCWDARGRLGGELRDYEFAEDLFLVIIVEKSVEQSYELLVRNRQSSSPQAPMRPTL